MKDKTKRSHNGGSGRSGKANSPKEVSLDGGANEKNCAKAMTSARGKVDNHNKFRGSRVAVVGRERCFLRHPESQTASNAIE